MNIQGLILIDVDAAALNNAGKNTSSNFDNAVKTKTIYKNGNSYVYVSGQAWRNWWRVSLQKNQGWNLSPVTREDKIAFTNANPIQYPDDDVFGYMRAASEIVKDAKGKEKKENITVTRVSPLNNSVLVSASAVRPVENWSSMARQEGDSVPYAKQEYSAVMKGMFSLDLDMIGTFSNYNKTGFKNLSDSLKEETLKMNGTEEIPDPFIDKQTLVRLSKEVRIQRATDTIKALKNISGGAMQTNNMADVTPKFIILATTKTGNHPFSHVVKSKGEYDESVVLNIEGLKEVIEDYKNDFVGNIYIGKRSGFFDDDNADLEKLAKENNNVYFGPVNQIIDKYIEELEKQME